LTQNTVAIAKVRGDVTEAVRKIIGLAGGLGLKRNNRVIIKPNVCNSKNPHGMVNTDFGVIKAIIDLARKRTERIVVVESDNISGSAEKRMSESGLLAELNGMDVEFINLSHDEAEVHRVAGVELMIPLTILKANCFINLPKIKTCGHTLVTLSLKNLFGVLQRAKKDTLHRHLDDILPYLVKVIQHDLVVVDGVIAMEGNGPVIGTPKNLGVVVAGTNPVAVDAICTAIMGFSPSEVRHLVRATKMGLGDIRPDRIEVLGEDWKDISQVFERPYSLRATLRSIRSVGKMFLS
jgi:uncharacterized protein (DUF362 family)